jgi:hypothetical protein
LSGGGGGGGRGGGGGGPETSPSAAAAVQGIAEQTAARQRDLEILLEDRKHSLQEFEAELLLAAQNITEFEERIQKVIAAVRAELAQIYALLDKITAAPAADLTAAERQEQAAVDFIYSQQGHLEETGQDVLSLLNGELNRPGVNARLADLEQAFSERTRGECRDALFGWFDLGEGAYEIGQIDALSAELLKYKQQLQIMNLALEVLTAEPPVEGAGVSAGLQAKLDALVSLGDQYIAIQALKHLQEYLAIERDIASAQSEQVKKNIESFKQAVMSKWEKIIRGYVSLLEIKSDAVEILDDLEKGVRVSAVASGGENSGGSNDEPSEQIAKQIAEALRQGNIDEVLDLLLDWGGNIPPEFASLLDLLKQKIEDKVLRLIADLNFTELKKMYDRLPPELKEFVKNLLKKELETNAKLAASLDKDLLLVSK